MPVVPSNSPLHGATLSRRDVLRLSAGVPAVFGLSALLGCRGGDEPAHKPSPPHGGGAGGAAIAHNPATAPDWWPYFVPKAKEPSSGEAIVVLRIPSTPSARAALGTILVDLVDHGSRDERLLMMGTRVGCLTDAQMRALVPTARAEDGLVLIDGYAKRVDGVPLSDADAVDHERVRAALEAISYGPGDARLFARAKVVRAAQKGEVLDSYDRLKTPADVEQAAIIVYAIVPAIAAELRSSADPGRRRAVEGLLDASAASGHSPAHPGLRIPEGIETSSSGGGCGGPMPDGTVIACGMALPTPGSYRFIQFLVDRTG